MIYHHKIKLTTFDSYGVPYIKKIYKYILNKTGRDGEVMYYVAM